MTAAARRCSRGTLNIQSGATLTHYKWNERIADLSGLAATSPSAAATSAI